MPEDADDAGYTEKIERLAEQYGARLYYITENTDVQLGTLDLTLYAPLGNADANERGLMILGAYDDFEFLVTGDADSSTESLLTTFYDLPDIELLVVGHHGSKYSTGTALLEETTPDVAFISVGYNTYGHPTQEVLSRLEERGIEVYRTDEDGNISLTVGKVNG
jgi:competence protein ComEC